MDWPASISSILQILLWSLQACFFSTGSRFSAVTVSAVSVIALVKLMSAWIRLWNTGWHSVNASFITFALALLTIVGGLAVTGNAHLDRYLGDLIENAKKESAASFADWRQVGFPEGSILLESNIDICTVLQKQIPVIQKTILLKEPFRSWPKLEAAPLSSTCDPSNLPTESLIKRGDSRFDTNFNSVFQAIEKNFRQKLSHSSAGALSGLLWMLAGAYVLGFISTAVMAYKDINE